MVGKISNMIDDAVTAESLLEIKGYMWDIECVGPTGNDRNSGGFMNYLKNFIRPFRYQTV